MTAPLQNLCAAVCGDGGAGRVHAPRKMEDAVCKQCAPSVWSSRTQKCGRIERSILVQDKGRCKHPSSRSHRPAKQGGATDCGLSEAGITGGRNGRRNSASLLKSRSSEVHPRGSPREYWPIFEPICAVPKIVNVLITKRVSCGYIVSVVWCVADKGGYT